MTPKVKTWRVQVIDTTRGGYPQIIWIRTINRTMARIILATEYPETWGKPIRIARFSD